MKQTSRERRGTAVPSSLEDGCVHGAGPDKYLVPDIELCDSTKVIVGSSNIYGAAYLMSRKMRIDLVPGH